VTAEDIAGGCLGYSVFEPTAHCGLEDPAMWTIRLIPAFRSAIRRRIDNAAEPDGKTVERRPPHPMSSLFQPFAWLRRKGALGARPDRHRGRAFVAR
jgi:hypothetical protein